MAGSKPIFQRWFSVKVVEHISARCADLGPVSAPSLLGTMWLCATADLLGYVSPNECGFMLMCLFLSLALGLWRLTKSGRPLSVGARPGLKF